MIPARLNVVTLGVRDLPRQRAFYEALGWTAHSTGDEFVRLDVGGAVLTLYPVELLAAEAHQRPSADPAGFHGFTLAVVVGAAEEVDDAITAATEAGGQILAEPVDREWGGRSGYFADPEGNAWEVAWLPWADFDDRGGLIWR